MRPQPLVSPGTGRVRRLLSRRESTLLLSFPNFLSGKTRLMIRKTGFARVWVGVFLFALIPQIARAQADRIDRGRNETGRHAPILVNQGIDETKHATLSGNTRPEATPEHDRGKVPDDYRLEHMLLQLKRSPEQEQALQQYLEELHTKGSPNFQRWLTAQEFGERFGVSTVDIESLTRWLEKHGLKVNVVYPSGMVIDFSGTARQVQETFHTDIHKLRVKGNNHVGNINDPKIPAAFAPMVAGIVSLHDFSPHAMHQMRKAGSFTFGDPLGGTNYAVAPPDLATIYNLNPLFSAGYSGQGQTVVVIEDTDVFSAADWKTFRSTFGLSKYTSASFRTIYPAPSTGTNNCAKPGIIAPNDAEAILDAEWASAAAPSASIVMATCADTTITFGGLIALQNLINASNHPPAIMSVSYGQCETENGAAANAAYNSAYQQAVSEGVSVFVAAGDSGAAGCDNSAPQATHGIGVNAFASTPYNVAVGGTDFSDTYAGTNSSYWNSTNTSTFGSARSYIPEIPWNDSCAGALFANYEGFNSTAGPSSFCNDPTFGPFVLSTVAGGGGPSACATGTPSTMGVVSATCKGWPKPSWQSVLGNPSDGVRDTPDISLFAADGLWGHYYIFCWSDAANGGAACSGNPSGWSGAGGTSFSSPIMAGIQAIVNQKTGARQGNPNPVYYQLAANEYSSSNGNACNSSNGTGAPNSCIFYDVTQGDMDVNCTGAASCFLDSSSQGVLSTSNASFQPAYGATTGWDFATGIGSVNAANLVNNWPGTKPTFTLSTSASGVSVTHGLSANTAVIITPWNGFNGSVSFSASGLPSGVTASFNPTSTQTTTTLTLTASASATVGTSTVTITGTSGSLTSATTISVSVVSAGSFTLSASPTTLSLFQGGSGTSTVTVARQNGFNGSVSLSASGLPSGVTAAFNPTGTATSSTLTLTASSTAQTGGYTVTVTGISGGLTNTTAVTLTLTPAPSFTLSASPSSLRISQGISGTTAITIAPQPGFTGSVALSTSALPAGVTASFNPASTTTSSTLTFTSSSTAATGTFVVTITGTSANSTKTTPITLGLTSPPLLTTWLDQDVGSVGVAGSASFSNGTFTLNGSGQQIWGSADGMNFLYQPLSGDGSITARVLSLQGGASIQGVGVMIRETLTESSTNAFAGYGQSLTFLDFRSTTGGATSTQQASTVPLPYWVKLVRSGTTFAGYSSLDGVNWTQIGPSQTINMAQNVYVGVAISSGTNSALSTATVDNVSVSPAPVIASVSATTGSIGSQVVISGSGFGGTQGTVFLNGTPVTINLWSATSITITIPAGATSGPLAVSVAPSMNDSNPVTFTVTSQPLPSGWLDQDVGAVGIAGSASYANGTFTEQASGQQIWSTVDGMHFIYQPWSGDGTIVARVLNLQGGSNAEGTGVMIRETLTPSSTNAFVGFSPSLTFLDYRNTTGGTTFTQQASLAAAVPYWVKLVRSGNTFTGYSSSDGANWVQIGSAQIINMAPNVYIGLALSSSDNSVLAAASLDNVSLSSPTTPNFSLSASPSSLSIAQGGSGTTTITLTTQNGFNGSVSLSASGLPSGITASFSPSSTSSSSALTLSASSAATTGNATVTISGSSGTLTNTTTIPLSVVVPPSFTLSASPSSVTIVQGASGTSTVTIAAQNGFSNAVTLFASGLPAGVTASFNPASATTASTLTLTAGSTATTGNASVTITGTSGSLTSTTSVALTVTAAPTFTLSPSPSSVTIVQGASGTSTITIAAQNGFSNAVTLFASGLPAGVTASFNPASATTASTLTLTAGSTATTGTANVTVTGTSGSLISSAPLALTVTAAPTSGLPSGWADADVGAVGTPGSAGFSNGTFTVNASGQQIWGTADGFNFGYQQVSGDTTIIARMVSVAGGAASESTGIMIRETLTAGSTNIYAAFSSGSLLYFDDRPTTGGTTVSQNTSTGVTLPYWVKIVRSGNVFTGYASLDGANWSQIGTSQTVTMAQNVYVGLAVSSNVGTLATATFDNVSITTPAAASFTLAASPSNLSITQGTNGTSTITINPQTGFTGSVSLSVSGLPSGVTASFNPASTTTTSTLTLSASSTAATGSSNVTITGISGGSSNTSTVSLTITPAGLPAGWSNSDVGSVGSTGSATYANGTFGEKASGQQIWGTADGFNFTYQQVSGDTTIISRMVSVAGGAASESTGIMIRETLTAGSTNIYAAFSSGSLLYFDDRPTTGGNTASQSTSTGVTLPYWVKIVRSGNTFSGYRSLDGVNWVQIGTSVSVNMASNVYVGLAVSSNLGTLATATFDNVSVTTP
jgi:Pro-kumamolisin, activation domain